MHTYTNASHIHSLVIITLTGSGQGIAEVNILLKILAMIKVFGTRIYAMNRMAMEYVTAVVGTNESS